MRWLAFLVCLPAFLNAFVEEVVAKYLCPATDWVVPYRRDRGLASHCRTPPRSAIIGTQYLQAAGLAHGLKLQGGDGIVYVSGGDGSVAQGDFYEALNYAALHKLPLIFLIHDDGWAGDIKTPMPAPSIAELCRGRCSLETTTVTDAEALEEAMERAISRARDREGPSLIVTCISPMRKELTWDPGIVILGQNVTHGLPPSERCFNTPLAEATIVGVALGLSLDGFLEPLSPKDERFLFQRSL